MVKKDEIYLLATALDLASQGIPVFPITPDKKEPPLVMDWENSATTEPSQINKWWTTHPTANIGVPVGRAGLYVVDPDGVEGVTNWEDTYELDCPRTRQHRTPRGGLHIFFKNPGGYRNTTNKLAPKIDTRGEGGYVLWPPSVVHGRPYTVEDDREPVDLPECLVEAINHKPVEHKKATGDDLDTEANISRARVYLLERAPPAIEGEGGDTTTYTVAACVRDYCISEDCCLGLMEESWNERCSPPWGQDDLEEKVAHAYKYPQNEIGSRAVPQANVLKWSALQAALPAPPHTEERISAPDTENRSSSRFRVLELSDYETMPEPDYWDTNKLLPRVPLEGSTVIIYGEFGSHKTNVTLTMCLEAVLAQDAKVIYAAGEGALGVGKKRAPAHLASRGIKNKDLHGRFAIVPGVPLLAQKADVAEFIEAIRPRTPTIIVLDTFATAISGTDENSSEAAQFLTGNGPVGLLRNEFAATVILPAHAGKDKSRGIRGNSGFGGNADVILACEAHKDKVAGDLIKITVEKMRDGEDGRCVYYAVKPGTVPVPIQIDEATYKARLAAGSKGAKSDDAGLRASVRIALDEVGARTFTAGLTDRELAERITGRAPTGDGEDFRQWCTTVEGTKKALKDARAGEKAWTGGLWSKEVSHEGGTLHPRWWMPRPN